MINYDIIVQFIGTLGNYALKNYFYSDTSLHFQSLKWPHWQRYNSPRLGTELGQVRGYDVSQYACPGVLYGSLMKLCWILPSQKINSNFPN